MKTKIVYALTSDESDIFLEQLIVSAYSLKQYNPNCYTILVVDCVTDGTIIGNRAQVLNNIDEKIVLNTPKDLDKKQRSRFIKTSLRKYIKGDFLFIDNDTIITGAIDEIDSFTEDVLAVLDRHLKINESFEKERIINQCSKAGHPMDSLEDQKYFNSGVMFVRDTDTTHRLYEKWHYFWNENMQKYGLNIDQPGLALANKSMGYIIKEMPGIWNCQITGNGLKDLHNAIIIHYFNSNLTNDNVSPCFYFSNPVIYWNMKRNNCIISDEMLEMIGSPKSAFERSCDILVGENQKIFHDIVIRFIYDQYYRHNKFYNLLHSIIKLYSRMRDVLK